MEKIELKKNIKKCLWGGAVLLILSLWCQGLVLADVFRYVDRNGVWHFTNRKIDGRYCIFIRSPNKTSSEYLVKYSDIVKKASDRFGIDFHFIKAIIRAESGFDHKAVSCKGAKGLMQLMPGTADDMAVSGSP